MQTFTGMSVLHHRKIFSKLAKYHYILLAVSLAMFVFFANYDLASAFDFSSESGRFSVTLPANPTPYNQPMKYEQLEGMQYCYEVVSSYYSMMAVCYFDLPEIYGKPESEAEARNLLAGSLRGALEYNDGVLLYERNSFYQNYPSLDYAYHDVNRKTYMHVRSIIARERVYNLIIGYKEGSQFPSSGSTLLKTFRIW